MYLNQLKFTADICKFRRSGFQIFKHYKGYGASHKANADNRSSLQGYQTRVCRKCCIARACDSRANTQDILEWVAGSPSGTCWRTNDSADAMWETADLLLLKCTRPAQKSPIDTRNFLKGRSFAQTFHSFRLADPKSPVAECIYLHTLDADLLPLRYETCGL